jgi:hypothetical protein
MISRQFNGSVIAERLIALRDIMKQPELVGKLPSWINATLTAAEYNPFNHIRAHSPREWRIEKEKNLSQKICLHCKKLEIDSKFSKCGGCQIAFYCSKECQRSNWMIHKKLCQTWANEAIAKVK